MFGQPRMGNKFFRGLLLTLIAFRDYEQESTADLTPYLYSQFRGPLIYFRKIFLKNKYGVPRIAELTKLKRHRAQFPFRNSSTT